MLSMQHKLHRNSAMLQGREKEVLELKKHIETERSAAKFWEQEAPEQIMKV